MFKSWVFSFLVLILIIVAIAISFVLFKRNITMSNKTNQTNQINQKINPEQFEVKKVIFATDDGVEIAADFYFVPGSKFAGIFLHMMSNDRKSYDNFTQAINQAGWSALSIDLRGHGESINSVKGKLNFEKFTDKDHQALIFDISAASNFLKSKGFAIDSQFLVGASIGANLSLKFLSENKKIKAVVLLSPGLNYKGILTEPLLSEEINDKILFISSSGDLYAYNTVQSLQNQSIKSESIIFTGQEHGTDILKSHKDAVDKIVNWLMGKLI